MSVSMSCCTTLEESMFLIFTVCMYVTASVCVCVSILTEHSKAFMFCGMHACISEFKDRGDETDHIANMLM